MAVVSTDIGPPHISVGEVGAAGHGDERRPRSAHVWALTQPLQRRRRGGPARGGGPPAALSAVPVTTTVSPVRLTPCYPGRLASSRSARSRSASGPEGMEGDPLLAAEAALPARPGCRIAATRPGSDHGHPVTHRHSASSMKWLTSRMVTPCLRMPSISAHDANLA